MTSGEAQGARGDCVYCMGSSDHRRLEANFVRSDVACLPRRMLFGVGGSLHAGRWGDQGEQA